MFRGIVSDNLNPDTGNTPKGALLPEPATGLLYAKKGRNATYNDQEVIAKLLQLGIFGIPTRARSRSVVLPAVLTSQILEESAQ